MVRENKHDGDTAKLHNPWDVSALRRRSVRYESLQDITGKFIKTRHGDTLISIDLNTPGKRVGVEACDLDCNIVFNPVYRCSTISSLPFSHWK